MSGYESVRRLIHEHLIPALERFTVLVSRLRGLSRFQVSNATLDLSTKDLNKILDTVSCLQLVGHHLLITTNAELQQFHAFSHWLHHEIDTQSSETSTADSPDKDPNIDHIRTLEYIQGAMVQSQLSDFLLNEWAAEESNWWDVNAEGRSIFDLYKREITQSKQKDSTQRLPGLESLLGHLDKLCSVVFTKIGETQKRNVRFASPTSLGSGVPEEMDLRMVIEEPERVDKVSLYIAVGPRLQQAMVRIYKISFQIEKGMSAVKGLEYASLRTNGWDVKDIKFVDDENVMLALSNRSEFPALESGDGY